MSTIRQSMHNNENSKAFQKNMLNIELGVAHYITGVLHRIIGGFI